MKEHTKSRRGCLCCKRRKVKCDETLPSCKNCSRRGDDCSFLRDHGPRASDHTPPPRSTGQSSAPTSSRPCLSGFDLNDIELTHQYLKQTCKTLWGRPGAQAVWQDDVFKTALKHPPLLDAILATAAMHKIVLAGTSCPELEQIALRKQTTALTGLKSLLHSVDISNYQAIFPLSCLVSYWAFSSWGLPSSLAILTETSCTGIHPTSLHKESKNPRIAKVMELFNIIQPMNAIVQEARSWIKQGQQSELMRMPSLETLPKLTEDEDLALSALGRQLESEADFDVTALMEDSCQTTSLRLMFRVRNNRDWAELVVAWGVQLPKPLLHRLERGDVAALTVLSYWAVCLHALRGRWWAGGWAEDLVTEIADVVHGPWHELVQWPYLDL